MTLAIIFDSVGAGEWLVLLAVLLVVIGPERLPATARKLASHYAKFRRAAESFKRQLMDMDLEMEREFRKAADEVKKVEAEMGEGGEQEKVEGEGEGTNGDQPHQES